MRRYRTVQELAEDLRNHAEGRWAEARRGARIHAVGNFIQTHGWWMTAVVVVGMAIYSGVIVLPGSALFLLAGVVAVFVAGYYLGTWDMGPEHTRKTLTRVAKMLPLLAVAMVAFYWLLPRLPETGTPLVMAAIVGGICMFALAQWRRRDRLGPLVLQLDLPEQRFAAWVCFAAFVVVLVFEFDELPDWTANFVPLAAALGLMTILLFKVRLEIRQRGLVVLGIHLPWTEVASYAWEPGRGRQEGRHDILWLRANKKRRSLELRVPLADRDRVDLLLEQQLTVWPE